MAELNNDGVPPPVWDVRVIIPVLSVLLCVNVGVDPSFAAGRRGSRHRWL